MSAKIAITRTDHTVENPRALASRHKYRDCRARLRAIALMIEDDLLRGEISRSVGVDMQTLRDWAIRYNAEGLDRLRDAARPGRPPKLGESQTAELVSLIETGSDPDAGEPSSWTLGTIQQWIKDRFDVDFNSGKRAPDASPPRLSASVSTVDPSQGKPRGPGVFPK